MMDHPQAVHGNALRLPFASRIAHTCVTSPPYWNLRHYSDLEPIEWPSVTFNPGLHYVGTSAEVAQAWTSLVRVLPAMKRSDWERTRQTFDAYVAPLVQRDTVSMPGCDPHCDHRWQGIPKVSEWCSRCGGWRGHLGLEPDPLMYIGHLILIFREVRRVIRDDGTLWLNIGDTYAGSGRGPTGHNGQGQHQERQGFVGRSALKVPDMAVKNAIGIPWRLAFALQADGWWLRSDIPWLKPNALPESVRDRPVRAHEYLFLLSKSKQYFLDPEAIKVPASSNSHAGRADNYLSPSYNEGMDGYNGRVGSWRPHYLPANRYRRTSDWYAFDTSIETAEAQIAALQRHVAHIRAVRDDGGLMFTSDGLPAVLRINTCGHTGQHRATYPPDLVAPCIRAGTSAFGVCAQCGLPYRRKRAERAEAGWAAPCDCGAPVAPALVFDPFVGSGTTLAVAHELGRRAVGVDLSQRYLDQDARQRLVEAEGTAQ
jgi:DNA modification methylase